MSKNKKIIIHNVIGILIALGITFHLYSTMTGIVLLLIWLVLFFVVGSVKAPTKVHGSAEIFLLFAILAVIKWTLHSPEITLLCGMILILALHLFNMWRSIHQIHLTKRSQKIE